MSSSTASAEKDFDPPFLEVYKQYFAEEENLPSLAGLCEYDFHFMVNNSPATLVKATWNKRFITAARILNVQISKKQPDWNKLTETVIRKLGGEAATEPYNSNVSIQENSADLVSTTTSASSKRSRSTQSSKTDSCLLTEEARDRFRKEYHAMEKSKKWFLRKNDIGDDVYVEDVMFAFGDRCEYEHAVHSFILDVGDPCWKSEFSADELQTIINTNNPKLPPLKQNVENVFEHCAASVSADVLDGSTETDANKIIDALWKSVTELGFFDPRSQPDQDWAQRTLLDFLNLYRRGTLSEIISHGSEMDFVVRCWSNLDKCFDDLAAVGRDRTCMSTCVRVNAQRAINGVEPVQEQQRSVRPDVLVMKDGLEYAIGECSKDDTCGVGKKEMIERQLHLTKILKDLLKRALSKGNNKISLARAIRVIALNQNSKL